MKGLTLLLRCQLCLTFREVVVEVRDKVELPKPWTARSGYIGHEIAKLYVAWDGVNGEATLPRLFCCAEHRDVFVAAEKDAADAAHAAGLKVAQRLFVKAMSKEAIKSMDVVTALATIAYKRE